MIEIETVHKNWNGLENVFKIVFTSSKIFKFVRSIIVVGKPKFLMKRPTVLHFIFMAFERKTNGLKSCYSQRS